MGAGNPLIRSFDEDRYSPSTYFIDFTEEYDLDTFVKEYLKENDDDRDFDDLSEEDKYQILNNQIEFDIEDFRENYFTETEFFQDKYWLPEKGKNYIAELSAEFRGGAIIIAESKDSYIVTTSDSEQYHFAISIVPKFKYDDIYEDVNQQHENKWDWYQNHNKDYYAMVERLSEKEYAKQLKAFLKYNEPTMRQIHEHYKKSMSVRNGAWMLAGVGIIGKDFKFL